MTNTLLFGEDIAKEIADALQEAGGLLDGMLIKETIVAAFDPDNITGSNQQSTPTMIPIEGFVEFSTEQGIDELQDYGNPKVNILGSGLQTAQIPISGDKVQFTLKGELRTFTLVALLSSDPVNALYTFTASE